MAEWDIIPPPSNVTVEHEHKPVLYLPDGRVLVRQAGFRAGANDAVSRMPEARRAIQGARRPSQG